MKELSGLGRPSPVRGVPTDRMSSNYPCESEDGIMKKRIMSALLAVGMVFTLLPTAVWAEDGIPYLDWDNDQKKLVGNTCESATKVESGITAWENGWYVVSESVTISDRITVTGEVYLILADDCTLTAEKGIGVPEGNSLTIYGQAGQSGSILATGDDENAGIGGNSGVSGTITINGGIVSATGGDLGAGIGGGYHGSNGDITINGGSVTAEGNRGGAGIGSGEQWSNEGTITINGGTVTATGGSGGAGIGSGPFGDGGIITITGGTVIADFSGNPPYEF